MQQQNRATAVLLAILAAVTTAAVSAGSFVTIDTTRRLQVTHWMWRGEPQVAPGDETHFGNTGRDGKQKAWYGLGQSLVMLPIDVFAHGVIAAVPGLPAETARKAELLLVSLLMQILVTAAVVTTAFLFLLEIGFARFASLLGALSLLFTTSFLHYVQEAQENNLLLLCHLLSLLAMMRWRRAERRSRALLIGIVLGFGLLTRLPFVLDCMAVFGLTAWLLRQRWTRFSFWALVGLAPFALADRTYQWWRFGSWWSVYKPVKVGEPFSASFVDGVMGALFSPENSIFLFDPLLLVALLLAVWGWRRLSQETQGVVAAELALLAVLVCFYASYSTYSGEESWGDRYTTTPVQVLAMLAVPMGWTYARRHALRRAVSAVALCSAGVQILSVLLMPPVENMQRAVGESGQWVIAERARNVAMVVYGRADGSKRFSMVPPEWRRIALLPFQLQLRYPAVARVAIVVWLTFVLTSCWLVVFVIRRGRDEA